MALSSSENACQHARLVQYVGFAIVLAFSASINFLHLGKWSWDHDEVATLVELGLWETSLDQGKMAVQFDRLPRLVPFWYSIQRLVLQWLPVDEFGTRVLSAVCGSLAVAFVFHFAWRARSFQFAAAIALVMGLNQTYIWLVQQNRFYSMGILFLVVALGMICSRSPRHVATAAIGSVAAVAAVLSHNLVAVVFWIGGIAAVMCIFVKMIPKPVAYKAILMAAVAGVTYALYLRPLMTGWISGGTGGTNELISFAAQLGIPTIALAGLSFGWLRKNGLALEGELWWIVVMGGGLAFIALSPVLLGNWNPRYALFFMMPFWVLAALSIEGAVKRCAGRWQRVVVYLFVVTLLMPKFASYWCDGSRHDFRTAARSVSRKIGDDDIVYSNWPLACGYYLKPLTGSEVASWRGDINTLDKVGWVVLASNAYAPPLKLPGYECEFFDEISHRRFDEQSHVIRVYRVTRRE